MGNTSMDIKNSGKPAPRWFRKFKKIWINTETAAIIILMAMGYAGEGLLILGLKTGTSWLLENLETILANGDDYTSNATNEVVTNNQT
jgi:hypothetical protein